MTLLSKYAGKYFTVDPNNPHAPGVCDRSGFVFKHKDLVKQMEWRGNALVWTGFLVGPPFVDKPQEQNRPPLVKDDPRPVINARLPEDYTDPDANPVLPNNELILKLQKFHWNN